MTSPRTIDPNTRLTPQQQRFADEYLIDMDATGAYRRAGYKATGDAARVNASKLLATPAARVYLQQRMQQISNRLGLSAERVLSSLAAIGFFDPRKLFDAHGSVKPPAEWDDETAAAVASLEVQELFAGKGEDRQCIGFVKKLRFASKVDALGKLAQHFGLLTSKVEVTGKDGGPILTHSVANILAEIDGSDTGIGPAQGRQADA